MNQTELRVGFYARVSSDAQSQAGTIASQVADLRQRIARDGLSLRPELEFLDEGFSGSTPVRPALERLRDQAYLGGLDRLYVHSPDRLARSYAWQFLLVEELQREGVELVFLNRPLGSSPEDNLLLQVQGMVAEYERAKIMERSRRGRLHAARQGNVSALGTAPYGYRYVSRLEGGGQARIEVRLEQAQVVRQIFQWVGMERLSIGQVCRRLAEQGITSPLGRPTWNHSTVWDMLRNPAYKGQAALGRMRVGPRRPRPRPARNQAEQPRRARSLYATDPQSWILIPVPAFVDEALFAAVAEQLAENRRLCRQRREGTHYLLSGLVVCKCCGYGMCGKKHECGNNYYRCTNNQGRVCANPMVRADRLEAAVWEDVKGLLEEPERVRREYERRLEPEPPAAGDGPLRRSIQQTQRQIDRLIDVFTEGTLQKQEFETRLKTFRERLARLEEQSRAEQDREAQQAQMRLVIGHLDSFAEKVKHNLHEADWAGRREIIRTLVKRVEVDREEVKICYRVDVGPFAPAPSRGQVPHCKGREEVPMGPKGVPLGPCMVPLGPAGGWMAGCVLRKDTLKRELRACVVRMLSVALFCTIPDKSSRQVVDSEESGSVEKGTGGR
ncbi:MAG: recombinase family protein [Tepidisphaerales bacterium]